MVYFGWFMCMVLLLEVVVFDSYFLNLTNHTSFLKSKYKYWYCYTNAFIIANFIPTHLANTRLRWGPCSVDMNLRRNESMKTVFEV